MGIHKVPGMVLLHCDVRKYDNDCLITFKVGPLRTQIHLLHPVIVGSTGGRLLLKSSGIRPSHSI
jgi:hypothetical protein